MDGWQVRDRVGNVVASGLTMSDIEPACYQGRTLFYLHQGEWFETDSPWMRRTAPDSEVYVRPTNYRADWLVTSRRGDMLALGNSFEHIEMSARAGRMRAVWRWDTHTAAYVQVVMPGATRYVIHDQRPYERPVVRRERWLVLAASGRSWARGERIEDVIEPAAEGNRRALWEWVDGEGYVLRAVGGRWLDT